MSVVRLLLVWLSLSFVPTDGFAQIFDWIDTYETEGNFSWLSDIVVDNNGNVYVAGIFRGSTTIQGTLISNLNRSADSYIAKYTADGNLIWLKQLKASSQLFLYDMTLAANGNVLATGSYQGSISIDGHNMTTISSAFDFGNTFVFELNGNGVVVAASDVGITQTNLADAANAITTDLSGNIYLAGNTGTSMLFQKLDKNRNRIWMKTYGLTSAVGSISAGTVTVDEDGYIYSSGIESGAGVLMRISPSGNIGWVQKGFGYIQSIQIDKNNDLVVSGTTIKNTMLGKQVMSTTGGLIAKMDRSGTMIWKHVIPGYKASDLDVDTHNDIYVTGSITSNVRFEPFDVALEGQSNIVLKSLSSNGTFRWVSKVGEKYQGDFGDLIETDPDGNIYIGNQIKKDSLAKFQCVEQRGNSRLDKFVAKIVPFKTVPIIAPPQICVNAEAEVRFTKISDYITYQWYFSGDDITTTTVNPTTVRIKSSTPGTIMASIITTVDLNCEIFKINHSIPIKVNDVPQTERITGKQIVCSGEENVEYTVAPSDDLTEWIPPINAVVTGTDNSRLQLKFLNNFVQGEVMMKRTNFCGSTPSAPLIVTALPLPGQTQNISGPKESCVNATQMNFVIPALPNADQYIWTVSPNLYSPTGLITTQPQITINSTNIPGEGYITVTGRNRCGTGLESEIFTITISAKPAMIPYIDGPKSICAETSAMYHIDKMENVDSFLWTYKDPLGNTVKSLQANEINFEVIVKETGIVQVSAFNDCGSSPSLPYPVRAIPRDNQIPTIEKTCNVLSHSGDLRLLSWFKDDMFISEEPSLPINEGGTYELRFKGACDTHSDFIVMKEEDILDFIPNIITPNNDDKNETFVLSTSLVGSSISIFDRWGMQVFSSNDYQNNWNASGLSSGVYFYLIQSACSNEIFKGNIMVTR